MGGAARGSSPPQPRLRTPRSLAPLRRISIAILKPNGYYLAGRDRKFSDRGDFCRFTPRCLPAADEQMNGPVGSGRGTGAGSDDREGFCRPPPLRTAGGAAGSPARPESRGMRVSGGQTFSVPPGFRLSPGPSQPAGIRGVRPPGRLAPASGGSGIRSDLTVSS